MIKYLKWLHSQINSYQGRNYIELFEIMYAKEFVWFIPNDDNRVVDGLDIRREFYPGMIKGYQRGCSVLEVLVGLSRHLAFNAGGKAEAWALTLLTNLELHKMGGHLGRVRAARVDEILDQLIWRTYDYDGSGGFFPLAWPKTDQRQVELWYQMHAYINELPDL